MKFSRADLPKIQNSLIVALLTTVLGAATLLYSLDRAQSTQLTRDAAHREQEELASKLKNVRDEENEIRMETITFNQLQARGVIGEERRLDWIELLKNIHRQRRLIDLNYEFAAPHALDPLPGKGLAFYASTMKLHLKLLHEEDLTRLLADLRSQAKALIQVRSCKVSRLVNGAAEHSDSPAKLLADCEIDWITLHAATNP